MSMTNEELAVMVQEDPKRRRELLPILWENVRGILYGKARGFYARHRESCTRRGVELADVDACLWEVLLDAAAAYNPEREALFVSYLSYPFKNRVSELLGIRTERGRMEPLNRADSLNRPLDADDSDGGELLDLVSDPGAAFLEDLLDDLNAEQEARILHEAVNRLPDQLREIITGYYFEGQTLAALAATQGVSFERIRQRRRKALEQLRKDRHLRLVCADRIANDRAAREVSRGNDRAAALLAIHDSVQAELDRLTRAYEIEADRAKPADGSDAPAFVDGLAGILSEYLTTKKA